MPAIGGFSRTREDACCAGLALPPLGYPLGAAPDLALHPVRGPPLIRGAPLLFP